MFDVEWAGSSSRNFELDLGVNFEEKCKALALDFCEKEVKFDSSAIGERWQFSGSVCSVGDGGGAMGGLY
jgi:hypothetical protein